VNLPVGAVLTATISRDGARFVIQLPHAQIEPRMQRLLVQLQLRDSPTARLTVHAMLAARLPLDPATARRIAAAVERGRDASHRRRIALFVAEAERKGVDLMPEAIDLLTGLFGHHGERRHGRRESSEHRHGNNGDETLEAQVRGVFSEQEQADHPLHLLNHIVAGDDHWVTVPLRAHRGDTTLSGVIRIRMPRSVALSHSGENTAAALSWDAAIIDLETPAIPARILLRPGAKAIWVALIPSQERSPDAMERFSELWSQWARTPHQWIEMVPDAGNRGFSTEDGLDIIDSTGVTWA